MNRPEKERVEGILCSAFVENLSVNYTIGTGGNKSQKLKSLIRYSAKIAGWNGKILLKGNAAALLTFPDKKAPFHRQMLADIALVVQVIGVKRVKQVLFRNNYIKSFHPEGNYIYLWLIGTDPEFAGKGEGTALLKDIILLSEQWKQPVYLETSMPENLHFYEKNGFSVYREEIIPGSSFKTWFLKREAGKA